MRYLNFAVRHLLMILLLLADASASSAKSLQQSPAYKLQRMARTRFRKLSECETKLLKAVATGDLAICGPMPSDSDEMPSAKDAASRYDNLRVELLRWLCVDPVARKLVDPKGIQVYGAYIRESLDLSFVAVPFPLSFTRSLFVKEINLSYSALINFDASGSYLHGIEAEHLSDRNEFDLGNATSEGEVVLTGSTLGGDLIFIGSTVKNHGAIALLADSLKVSGNVLLSEGFNADGQVILIGSDIGRNLNCARGRFNNRGGFALSADDLKVGGSVFLHDGFSAEGEVRLIGADIGHNLDCVRGAFKNPSAIALLADDLRVGGYVALRDGFNAEGGVSLMGANIGDQLTCIDGTFKNPNGVAVSAEGLNVSRDADFGAGNRSFELEGTLDLHGAEIKGGLQLLPKSVSNEWALDLREVTATNFHDKQSGWPVYNNLKLDGFVYGHIDNDSPKDAKKRVEWLRRQGAAHFAIQPYEQLAKVLREEGDDAGARAVLIKMHVDQFWNTKIGFLERCKSVVLWATIGYGYAPWRALWGIALLVVTGFFLFRRGIRRGWIISTEEHPERYKPFSPLTYSLETLLPLVDLYQSKHWIPDANTRDGRNLRRYLWFHTLAGWFFASMLIAGVTGLVQK